MMPPRTYTAILMAVSSVQASVESIAPQMNRGLRASSEVKRNLDWIAPTLACSPSICPTSSHLCLANPNHPQRTTDDTCSPCQGSQTYWPCDVAGLCYCWDKANGEKRIPPAPSTKSIEDGGGLDNNSWGNYVYKISDVDPCELLTENVFKILAPEARAPYTYRGFCEAVRLYNVDHPAEGVFNMGSEWNQRMELAAFFGNAMHESDEFKAGREYLMCADQITHGGETYCKPCDSGSFDWENFKCPASLASEGRAFNSYCQSNLLPPDACECDDVYEDDEMNGYVKADQVYFGRGSIQLSWNYNYIRASVALTGAPQTFCQRPDLVATKEEYAWGAGLFFWMENIKNDKTCHQSVLLNSDFGETLDNINGGLECPSDDHGWHGKAVQLRLNRYCRAARALSLDRLQSLDGCWDMNLKMDQCLEENNCPDCKAFVDKIGLLEGGPGANSFSDSNINENHLDEAEPFEKDEQTAQQHEVIVHEQGSNELDQNEEIVDHGDIENINEFAETGNPTFKPTSKPVNLYIPKGPCSGEPCFIPPEIKNDPNSTLQFCRNSDGICGVGSIYCNAMSTWTSFCMTTCDADSPYGCAQIGCSTNCNGESQICVGNLNAFNPISDEDCAACANGQNYWPCDIQSAEGCWCYDTNLPRVEPASPSGLELASKSHNSASIGVGVCGTIIDEELFDVVAPNAVFPFTYQGFCQAVDHYNLHHAEKIFRMGSYQNRLSELAAFLGIASHETNGFVASREYLACGDNKVVNNELYCKPCAAADYNYDTHTCDVSMLAGDQSYYNFCQPYSNPPDGCSCEFVKQVESSGALQGHMLANDIFFGRGSIQLSHNFNYIKASASMTGSESLCSQPEMLALSETYSWGVGMYLWMDLMSKEGLTSHVSVLQDADYGGALNIINGGNECPVAEDDSFFSKAIVNRIDHYCNAAKLLGTSKLLGLNGCDGLDDVFSSCIADGSCPRCEFWHPDYQAGQPFDYVGNAETISTVNATTTAETIGASSRPRRTSIPTKLPTKRPTRAPTTPPTVLPSSSPIKDENNVAESDLSSEASAFASHGVAITSHDEKYNKPGQNTQADTFAVTSHSKERTKSPVISSPKSSPVTNPPTQPVEAKSEGSINSMADWSLTSVIDIDGTASTNPPANEAINVQDITFRPPHESEPSYSYIEEVAQQNKQEFDPMLSSEELTVTQPTTTQLPMDSIMEMSAIEELTETQSTTTQPPMDSIMEMSAYEESTLATTTQSPEENFSGEIVKTSESIDPTQTGDPVTIEESYSMEQAESVPKQDKVDESTGLIYGRISHATKDGESIGLRAILVDLFECSSQTDVWISGTRTASAGDYIFEELENGEYYIKITVADIWGYTYDNLTSDVDAKGKSECIELTLQDHAHTINADLVKATTIPSLDYLSDSVSESITDEVKETMPGVIDMSEVVENNCTGQPCINEDECRSKYSFCGSGEEYCNEHSTWKPLCPTFAPTLQPSDDPTTSQPTFIVDLETQCTGEPCIDNDGTWCRSELGFCGGGSLYCNIDSVWLPDCITLKQTTSPSKITSTVPFEYSSEMPSPAPHESSLANWGSFALPTLMTVSEEHGNDQNSLAWQEQASIDNENLLPTITDEEGGNTHDDDDYDHDHDDDDDDVQEAKQENAYDLSFLDRFTYLGEASGSFLIPSIYRLAIAVLVGILPIL